MMHIKSQIRLKVSPFYLFIGLKDNSHVAAVSVTRKHVLSALECYKLSTFCSRKLAKRIVLFNGSTTH
jgi:hypothetical protein